MAINKTALTGSIFSFVLCAQMIAPVLAQPPAYPPPPPPIGYRGYASHVRYSYHTWASKHPKMKAMAVDGAVGTAVGALVGAASGRGALHGALIGAGSGAGIGLLRSSQIGHEHPLAKNVATAGIAGLGLYLAAKHGHDF